MSRVTAAFVCALCDPDDPRPASIMCSNNCGRYVCAVHAMPRRGPGSAMVCLACAEALDLIEKPKPQPEPTPIVVIPSEPIATPSPQIDTTVITSAEAPMPIAKVEAPIVEPPQPKIEEAIAAPTAEAKAGETSTGLPSWGELLSGAPGGPEKTLAAAPAQPVPDAIGQPPAPAPTAKFDADATMAGPKLSASREMPAVNVIPAEAQSQTARRLVEPPPPPQSSEKIVSQRGNTLQVPKVTQTLGKPPQPLNPRPRVAQRAEAGSNGLNRQILLMAIGSIVLGIIGFVLILAALQ